MRKILSILIALGLVLGLSMMAVPVGAQPPPCATVTATVPPFCAGGGDEFTIITTSPVTLLAVNDKLSVEFGAGTTFGAFLAGDITVNAVNVDVTKVEKTGSKLVFPIPVGVAPLGVITIVIDKVVNPAVPGVYDLKLNYKLSCCEPVVFCTVEYTVVPATSTYGLFWDSSMTYNGIALGFVPPFKACGQDTYPGILIDPGKWANYVNFILMPTLVGCAGPCATHVDLTLNVTAAPAGANVTLSFNGTKYYPVVGTAFTVGNTTLGFNTTLNVSAAIHFDTVGDYQICLEAFCPPGSPSCTTGCDPTGYAVAEECWDIAVYQWKDAVKIPLFRKWNLISLPLVPLVVDQPIADQLAALPNASTLIKGVYYFDQCADEWLIYGNGQTSLTTMVDGVSYWVKVDYSHTDPLKAPGLPAGGLWVWGTEKPVPPNSPSAYAVCEGWDMVGFTGLTPMADGVYLWNWWPFVFAEYGAVFGWDPLIQSWWSFIPGMGGFPWNYQGEGYWISFAHDGMIYPP